MGLRKLSAFERYFYLRSVLNLHSCFYVGIKLNQLPTKTQLQHAVKRTIDKFVQLRSNVAIDKKDNKPYLKILDQSIEFDDVVEFVDWMGLDENNVNYIFQNYAFPYHTEEPLWKILIIPHKRTLVLLMSHILFDGISGVIIWKEFLKNLQESTNAIENNITTVYVPDRYQSFANDHHAYEDWPINWKTKVSNFLLGQYLKWNPLTAESVEPSAEQFKFNNYSFPQGIFQKHLDSGDNLYQVRNDNLQWNVHLNSQELQKVLLLCKKHKVSLNSLITALFTKILTNRTDPSRYSGSKLSICVPINTRLACNKFLQNDDYTQQLGNFVAAANLNSYINDAKPLWELAGDFQSTIKQRSQDGVYSAIGECSSLNVIDIQKFLEARAAASKPADTFEVSNLGFQSFNDLEGPFKVIDAFFNQPQGISANFFCSVLSTDGGLNCHVTYPRDLKEDLTPCMQYADNWLHKAGR